METPRIHLVRQLLMLAVILAVVAWVFWPRSVPDCSKSTGAGDVHVSMPQDVHHLGLILTCAKT